MSNKFDHISTEELLAELDKRKGPSKGVPWWDRSDYLHKSWPVIEYTSEEWDRQQEENKKWHRDNYLKLLDEWERKPYPKGPPPGL
jgi:hypothetical protein